MSGKRKKAEAVWTAHYVKDVSEHFNGTAFLYRMEPPLEGHGHVVVSATIAPFSGPETYIFGSDAEGEVSQWGELDGSFKGGLDHERALRGAGYEVVNG